MPLISATDNSRLEIGEVAPIVGQHGVEFVGDRVDEMQQEVSRDPPCGLLVQLGEGELRGPIDSNEEVEPALRGAYFGDVEVIADRVGLEFALYAPPSSTSERREMPCRCRQRCKDEQVRSGIVAYKAHRQSPSGSSVCWRNATMVASPQVTEMSTSALGAGRQICRRAASSTWQRSWDGCHGACPTLSGSLDYLVLLDGLPLSLWQP
jgi:hypothetical protein